MMMLHARGVPLADLRQETLFREKIQPIATGRWKTKPEALEQTLQSFAPNDHYSIAVADTPEEMTKILLSAFAHSPTIPAALLINGCAHWTAVSGVRTDVRPVPGSTATICGFFMDVPQQGRPIVHSDGDTCAVGLEWGANYFLDYWGWFDVLSTCPDADEKIVAVCGPRGKIGGVAFPPSPAQIDGALDLDERSIPAAAVNMMRQLGLVDATAPDDAFTGIGPYAVRRLDNGHRYELVTVRSRDSYVANAMWRSGFRSAYAASRYDVPVLSPGELAARLLERLRARFPSLPQIDAAPITIDDELVWRPCKESATPHHPFYVVHVPTRSDPLYVRTYDLRIFDRLSDPCHGG